MPTTLPSGTSLTPSLGPSPRVDLQLHSLLWSSYVDAGFTDPEVGRAVFVSSAVHARGELWLAWQAEVLVGAVIYVAPQSPGRRIASPAESELQLLAVSPAARRCGIGRALIEVVFDCARRDALERVVLWTQPEMLSAQRLYAAAGFRAAPGRNFTNLGREFWVLEADVAPAF